MVGEGRFQDGGSGFGMQGPGILASGYFLKALRAGPAPHNLRGFIKNCPRKGPCLFSPKNLDRFVLYRGQVDLTCR